ncbi:MAG TPA: hypothetical protein P5550_05660 [Bacteroidales bacterium]|nr:hypothetical protein [Bacteroidales bacterium]HRZ76322.1 hypothetical protein [Bacteroidales bacterium]
MKKSGLILFLALLLGSVAGAQTGYLGKRFILYEELNLCPAWVVENKGKEMGMFKYDLLHTPGILFLLDNDQSLGLEFAYGKTSYRTGYYIDVYVGEDGHSGWNELTLKGLSLDYRAYMEEHAPRGMHFQLQLNYYRYTTDQVTDTLSGAVAASGMFGASMGMGKTFILWDYLTLTPSWSTGIAFGKGKMEIIGEDNQDPVTLADSRIRWLRMINVGLSVGVIPY